MEPDLSKEPKDPKIVHKNISVAVYSLKWLTEQNV